MSKPIDKVSADKITHNFYSSIKQKIDCSLLTHVYQQLYLGQFTSLFCATIVVIALYNAPIKQDIVISWYMLFVGIVIFRMILAKLYMSRTNHNENIQKWRKLFLIGALLGGIGWGLVGSILFSQVYSQQQTLIILILAGITAGATPLLAAELSSAVVFLTACLMPLIFRLVFFDDYTDYSLFSITVAAYYVYLLVITFKLHNTIKDSITLKFENDVLLQNLSRAKHQLELNNKNLERAATHDPLTQVANRSLFETSLDDAIRRANENKQIFALLYIDIDNFKDVNDAHGHHAGDQLLLKLVERLRKNIRATDIISRLGGDELTIILENITDAEIIFSIARIICMELSKPFDIQGHEVTVTSSIGVSIYPVDGEDVESLLNSADVSMYYVKEHGKNNYHVSDEVSEKRNILDKIIKFRSDQNSIV